MNGSSRCRRLIDVVVVAFVGRVLKLVTLKDGEGLSEGPFSIIRSIGPVQACQRGEGWLAGESDRPPMGGG